jgi:chemotaxis protein methyltransferase CheR
MKIDSPVNDSLCAAFNEYLARHTGLFFPRERWPDMKRGLFDAARDLGQADVVQFVENMMEKPLTRDQIELLARYLTVGETHFFRDANTFAVLEEHVLVPLIRRRRQQGRHLRLWSAACSSGEEAFSIMILLKRLLPDLDDWQVAMLATDINLLAMEKATRGIYSEWSFRGTDAAIMEKHFTRQDKINFALDPEIVKKVSFSYLNLADDVYPSLTNNTNAMDVIFCRNAIMYFSAQRARQVFENLFHCLVDGGWLVVSPVDIPQTLPRGCQRMNYPGVILFRKNVGRSAQTVASVPRYSGALDKALPGGMQNRPAPSPGNEPRTAVAPLTGPRTAPSDAPVTASDPIVQARALYRQGLYRQASEKLLTLVDGDGNIEAVKLLVEALSNEGKLVEALEYCEQAISINKLSGELIYLRAILLQEMGRDAEAVTSLNQVIYLDPEFPLAWFTLGKITQQQGRQKETDKNFSNALSLLESFGDDECLADFDGMTAGSLRAMIQLALQRNSAA